MACHTTIYRRDYTPKRIENLKEDRDKYKSKNIIQRDPIADTYKNYLYIDDDDKIAYSEKVDEYFEKAKDTYPWFTKVTENKPIDKNHVQKNKIYKGRTVYQVDYCDLEKDIAYKEYMKSIAVKLPLDTVIPMTSQMSGYRNPRMLDSNVYKKSIQPRPQNNLVKDDKLREILHVTTGDSEYMKVIGKLGEQIITEELHGKIERFAY